jgi:hypothetical protein
MAVLRTLAGRDGNKRKLAGFVASGALIAVLATTALPAGTVPTGTSAALAELVKRSPGKRTKAVALKAKNRRAAASPAQVKRVPRVAKPKVAKALPVTAGPEAAVPPPPLAQSTPVPAEVFAPPAPAEGAPVVVAQADTPQVRPIATRFPAPIGGFLFGPPGGGGGGGIGATPPDTGGPIAVPTPPPPPVAGAVPEPSTWLMLILGFGALGQAIRRRARIAPA